MSVFRTAYPNDSFTASTPDGPVVIGYGGTAVLDAYDASIRSQAAASGIVLLEGGVVVPPSSSPLQTQVAVIAAQVSQMPAPLVEQATRVIGPAWGLARSGQTVPVSLDGATGNRTLQLEAGGTGSRLAVRLDVASADGYTLGFTGTGSDVVPAVQLATAGSIVVMEGIVGGGGWRVVAMYAGTAVAWSQITGKPTIPTQLSQLGGAVNDGQIPDHITRDTELADGLAAKSNTGHTHPYAPASHTHTDYAPAAPTVLEARVSAGNAGLAGGTWWDLTSNLAVVSDPAGMLSGGGGTRYIVTLPTTGRWDVLWTVVGNGFAAGASLIANIALNPTAGLTALQVAAGYSAFRGYAPTFTTGVCTAVGSAKFTAGDQLTFGFYGTSGSWNYQHALEGVIRSKLVVQYRGPN